MARALNKVQKKISKKRGGKPNSLHENSRDAQRLRRAGAREEKLARVLDAAVRANHVYGKGHCSRLVVSVLIFRFGSGQSGMVQNSTRRVFGPSVRRRNARLDSKVCRVTLSEHCISQLFQFHRSRR
jgi:hypothetical protein